MRATPTRESRQAHTARRHARHSGGYARRPLALRDQVRRNVAICIIRTASRGSAYNLPATADRRRTVQYSIHASFRTPALSNVLRTSRQAPRPERIVTGPARGALLLDTARRCTAVASTTRASFEPRELTSVPSILKDSSLDRIHVCELLQRATTRQLGSFPVLLLPKLTGTVQWP